MELEVRGKTEICPGLCALAGVSFSLLFQKTHGTTPELGAYVAVIHLQYS
jgi:hypothetical protein